MKSKATFKALRETIGMSQHLLAERVGVDVRSVKRWEHPDNPWNPPQDAWDVLEEYRTRQLEEIEFALNKVDEIEGKAGNPPRQINLTYWSKPEFYEKAHPGEGRLYQMANATARLIGAELEAEGYEVNFSYNDLAD